MSLEKIKESCEKNTLTKKYIVPQRVITTEKAENTNFLLLDSPRQAKIHIKESCTVNEGGYVVLDFGSELQGGADITLNRVVKPEKNKFSDNCKYGKMRLVFGESVSEAMSEIGKDGAQNDHAPRDIEVSVSSMSTQRFGNTGFRFLKIEAVDGTLEIGVVKGVLEYKDIEYKGTFRCNDERLNEVFDTAAYTVHLNMQDYIWDGIKRDRLVWIGDMHPEVSTILSVFGYDESIKRSLDFSRDSFSLDSDKPWMVFPSYSGWWITIHRDVYLYTGDKGYLVEQKEYMYKLVNLILAAIHPDGQIDFTRDYLFVDWSSANTPEMEAGFRGCMVMALESAADVFEAYGDEEMKNKCLSSAENLKKIIPEYRGNKQVTAMCNLSGLVGNDEAEEILTTDLLSGLSTFYGYYVLLCLSKLGKTEKAIEIVRGYWGAMLDLGATTFFEDFDIDWMKNAGRIDEIVPEGKVDIHTAYGKHCYKQLRHSLCHGWASGPVPFLMRHVLGVEVLEPGCKKIKISPNLCDLEWVKGTFPTPYGVVEIEHRKTDGRVESKINAPDGVAIERFGVQNEKLGTT